MLKLCGFRYSTSRDAYVLRGIGNKIGPVYRVGRHTTPTGTPANRA